MKRLTTEDVSNAGISEIELDPEVSEQMTENTFKALRKFSSNKKTRAVHKILENNLSVAALFHGNAADYLVAPNAKNNVLHNMLFNLAFFDESLDRNGAIGYATQLNSLRIDIQKEKTYLGDKQIYNLEKLNENKEEISAKLLKSINYIKLVDGLYFGWLLLLARTSLENESLTKPKIVTTTADILASIIKKMYLGVNSKMEPEVHQLIEAISIYFMRIYYYGETAQYVLNKLKLAFDEDVIETIKKTKVTQFKEFNELSIILKESQLLPFTTNTFDLQMAKMFGKYGYEYYIQKSLMNFIAFMANLSHPTQLFKEAYGVDQEANERLEQLLLNEQKKIKLDKREL